LSLAQQVVALFDNADVLKVDADNEVYDRPGIAPNIKAKSVTIVEYQKSLVEKAKTKFANRNNITVIEGDIRRLKEILAEKSFDIVFDFSTLDHVPERDVPQVFDGYKYVLREKGMLVLITWFTTNPKTEQPEWKPTNQYFFNRKFVETELAKAGFMIKQSEPVKNAPAKDAVYSPQDYLHTLICERV